MLGAAPSLTAGSGGAAKEAGSGAGRATASGGSEMSDPASFASPNPQRLAAIRQPSSSSTSTSAASNVKHPLAFTAQNIRPVAPAQPVLSSPDVKFKPRPSITILSLPDPSLSSGSSSPVPEDDDMSSVGAARSRSVATSHPMMAHDTPSSHSRPPPITTVFKNTLQFRSSTSSPSTAGGGGPPTPSKHTDVIIVNPGTSVINSAVLQKGGPVARSSAALATSSQPRQQQQQPHHERVGQPTSGDPSTKRRSDPDVAKNSGSSSIPLQSPTPPADSSPPRSIQTENKQPLIPLPTQLPVQQQPSRKPSVDEEIFCDCAKPHKGTITCNAIFDISFKHMFDLLFAEGGSAAVHEAHKKRLTTDLKFSEWKTGENGQVVRKLTYKYAFKAMLVGKISTPCYEEQEIIKKSESSSTPQVPYGTMFCVINRYCVTHAGHGKSHILVHTRQEFVKPIILADALAAASVEGTSAYFRELVEALKVEVDKVRTNSAIKTDAVIEASVASADLVRSRYVRRPSGPRPLQQQDNANGAGVYKTPPSESPKYGSPTSAPLPGNHSGFEVRSTATLATEGIAPTTAPPTRPISPDLPPQPLEQIEPDNQQQRRRTDVTVSTDLPSTSAPAASRLQQPLQVQQHQQQQLRIRSASATTVGTYNTAISKEATSDRGSENASAAQLQGPRPMVPLKRPQTGEAVESSAKSSTEVVNTKSSTEVVNTGPLSNASSGGAGIGGMFGLIRDAFGVRNAVSGVVSGEPARSIETALRQGTAGDGGAGAESGSGSRSNTISSGTISSASDASSSVIVTLESRPKERKVPRGQRALVLQQQEQQQQDPTSASATPAVPVRAKGPSVEKKENETGSRRRQIMVPSTNTQQRPLRVQDPRPHTANDSYIAANPQDSGSVGRSGGLGLGGVDDADRSVEVVDGSMLPLPLSSSMSLPRTLGPQPSSPLDGGIFMPDRPRRGSHSGAPRQLPHTHEPQHLTSQRRPRRELPRRVAYRLRMAGHWVREPRDTIIYMCEPERLRWMSALSGGEGQTSLRPLVYMAIHVLLVAVAASGATPLDILRWLGNGALMWSEYFPVWGQHMADIAKFGAANVLTLLPAPMADSIATICHLIATVMMGLWASSAGVVLRLARLLGRVLFS